MTTLLKLLVLLLNISVLALPAEAATSPIPDPTLQVHRQLHFLAGVKSYATLLNQYSVSRNERARDCFCLLAIKSGSSKGCPSEQELKKRDNQFEMWTQDLYGRDIVQRLSCDEFVSTMKRAVSEAFPQMRMSLLQMRLDGLQNTVRLGSPGRDPYDGAITGRNDLLPEADELIMKETADVEKPDFVWQTSVQHPVLPWPFSPKEMRTLQPATRQEYQSAVAQLNIQKLDFCAANIGQFVANEINNRSLSSTYRRYMQSLTKWRLEPLCESTLARDLPFSTGNMENAQDDGALFRLMRARYTREAKARRDRAFFVRDYIRAVSTQPILLLLRNDRPTPSEFADAFAAMTRFASQRQSDLLKRIAAKRLAQRINEWRAGRMNEAELRKLRDDLSFLTQQKHGMTYALFNLKAESIKINGRGVTSIDLDDKTRQQIEESMQRNELTNLVKGAGELLAVNAACAVIATRFRLVGGGCALMLGIPLNAYFFFESATQYRTAFTSLLATYDINYVALDFNEINTKGLSVALGAALLPLGGGAPGAIKHSEFNSAISKIAYLARSIHTH